MSDAPRQGRKAAREGWGFKSNPFIKGSHKWTVWDAEWKAETADMWLRHVRGPSAAELKKLAAAGVLLHELAKL